MTGEGVSKKGDEGVQKEAKRNTCCTLKRERDRFKTGMTGDKEKNERENIDAKILTKTKENHQARKEKKKKKLRK